MLDAVGGSKTCICALTWALEVMLVPLTFLCYISLLCIKYIFVYVVIPLFPQANNASTYGVVRVLVLELFFPILYVLHLY